MTHGLQKMSDHQVGRMWAKQKDAAWWEVPGSVSALPGGRGCGSALCHCSSRQQWEIDKERSIVCHVQ